MFDAHVRRYFFWLWEQEHARACAFYEAGME